jgi:hypothetical protein
MGLQERLMLATMKGIADARVQIAKASVRAAFVHRDTSVTDYSRGFRDACRMKSVEHLRDMRDVQRTIYEYCRGVGYNVRKT